MSFVLLPFSKNNKFVLTVAGENVLEGKRTIVCRLASVKSFSRILEFTPLPVIEPSGNTIAHLPLGFNNCNINNSIGVVCICMDTIKGSTTIIINCPFQY